MFQDGFLVVSGCLETQSAARNAAACIAQSEEKSFS
jgi:hypothetical protein